METSKVFAFLDINPLSDGHAVHTFCFNDFYLTVIKLIIPKHHGAKITDVPDEDLQEILPVAKKIAKAVGCADFNILQNNGKLAHQEVEHVHFHMIPKPNASLGLGIKWSSQATDHGFLSKLAESIRGKLE